MPALARELRQILERTIVDARRAAESAAKSALATLAVDRDKPFEDLSEAGRALRRALRAKERQLGSHDSLVSEIAYQQWHRMLFARFLAENGLLMHPEAGVSVSLLEVADLAREEGEPDSWVLAARYAAKMLPAIFREGDPELAIRFAPEGRKRLEDLLTSLPAPVFTSDDGLGWVYQFWQSEMKKEVNRSGRKIGAAELPAVTQLFTENYMVRFLLENSLGAWWAGRHPNSPLLERFTYLRWTEEHKPAAGTFDGWPDRIAEVTVMDPCCGSGHFLTVAFEMLTAMRIEEEGLSLREAGDAVIAQNLFGLEIDPRCTQIAAFALGLAAWRSSGYRQLPAPNIACSGIAVAGQLADWKKLAEGDQSLEDALTALHEQFRNAPELGSLLDPRSGYATNTLFSAPYDEVAPTLEHLLAADLGPEAEVTGWAAAGMARAAELLGHSYTLVTTNVPYLLRRKQNEKLRDYCAGHYPSSKNDLATCFLERSRAFTTRAGAYALVTPQNWLFLTSYERLRRMLLTEQRFGIVARLGEGGFESSAAAGAFVQLVIFYNERPESSSSLATLDVSQVDSAAGKASALVHNSLIQVSQRSQLSNPDARITFDVTVPGPTLGQFAGSLTGVQTGDGPRFLRLFWELQSVTKDWVRHTSSVVETVPYGGREQVLLWRNGEALAGQPGAFVRGERAWGSRGVVVSLMREMPVTLFAGGAFDQNCAVVVPTDYTHLPAIWEFCQSPEFGKAVRRLDPNVKVTNATLEKVPFDVKHWNEVARSAYPGGLPTPNSNDPTQWLFRGNPVDSTEPLQVAVVRLLGYRWPDQKQDSLDELADDDGVVAIPAVAGEPPAAQRVRAVLERAWGGSWSPVKLGELLAQKGASGNDLESWLRDSFFVSHAKLFHNRPFIWHIWDGRKDGFGVLVNYHRLDRQLLDRIAHSLLGSWLERQTDEVRNKLPGAEARLIAAQDLQRKLELVLEGEPPYDIYVRWKPVDKQPIGWDPDLNDGVRLNIRPFVTAGVLRSKFTVDWKKDRGKDLGGSERVNDRHLNRAEKLAARAKARQ